MPQIIRREVLGLKRYIQLGIVLFLLLAFGAVTWAHSALVNSLSSQTLAKRWSGELPFAQESCFFLESANFSRDQLTQIRYQMNEAITNAGVEEEEASQNGRKFVDAYSAITSASIGSARSSMSVRAVAVGGDFFLFHPMTLLSGGYFDGDDINEDGVIIDELTAWQLFGSNNVAGQEIELGNKVLIVRGVIRMDDGWFSKAAGENAATIFVAYPVMEQLAGGSLPIQCYEALMVSPVKTFAQDTVKNALGEPDGSYVLVENSTRFGLAARLDRLRNLGVRSMRLDPVVYPYWENRARGCEDISTILLVIQGILIVYPVVYVIQLAWQLFYFIKRRGKKR